MKKLIALLLVMGGCGCAQDTCSTSMNLQQCIDLINKNLALAITQADANNKHFGECVESLGKCVVELNRSQILLPQLDGTWKVGQCFQITKDFNVEKIKCPKT